MHAFDIGAVFTKTFAVWFRNLLPFTCIMFIAHSPVLAVMALMPVETEGQRLLLQLLPAVLSTPLGYLAAGAITYGAFQELRGNHASFWECLTVGLRRLLPMLGTGLVVTLLYVFGLLLCVVPGLYFMCKYWVAIPTAVVERAGVARSMHRSEFLSAGLKWQIFAVLLVFMVIVGVPAMLASVAIVFLTGLPVTPEEMRNQQLLSHVVAIAIGSPAAVAATVGYHELRAVKEGVGIEEIAAVFA